ncbi:eukaryotic translation initiation factor 3 subunit L [Dendroctonus ponderosae]|uniref:Eukaryotic translation initiation factor 3 subunit L n=1 Tax=Dendroctonus ponderosae TaxID=77166 RepID=J3JYS9_DENPD|nr:eukaryotic translation initiation factor 3 subunit L [Dendroctonus ponderosae]AEE63367.1 unknown [Dendroctonus ponderosae]
MAGYNEEYEQNYDYNSYDEFGGHTGDPNQDAEFSRQQYTMPDKVKNFLIYFRNHVNEGLVFELQTLYEMSWPKLTEDYFEKRPWPEQSDVLKIVGADSEVFIILYKELYFRHIYARIQGGPTLEQRFNSFYNYCDLFNYILSAPEPVPLELPDLWLWELIDEFVYQFQSFSQYRARLQKKTQQELETLNSNNKVWNVLCVLNVLHSLVDKSNIKQQLEVYASGGDPDSVAGQFGRNSLYKMLGYFSLVGLLRLHSLLGDYYQAIKVLENIEVHKKSQYAHIPACQISTSYYVGFAYMMMRRYSDAIRTFSGILLYIQRTKQLFASKTYQHDQINKQTDQMYHLLAICLVLHPQCIDESIQQTLRDKSYHEKMYKMQYGDLQEFENSFVYACPKFLSPYPTPIVSGIDDVSKEAIKHQTQVFMDEVQQQKMLPTIRSYLKLYTTLPLSKLATFMAQNTRADGQWDLDKETQSLLIHLLCFKHKMKNVVWSKGASGLDGKFQSGSELDFYIDNEMIHIADTKVAHRYGDFFIRKILKFEDLNRKLHMIKM